MYGWLCTWLVCCVSVFVGLSVGVRVGYTMFVQKRDRALLLNVVIISRRRDGRRDHHASNRAGVQPGKTLFPSALEANGYATESAIIELLRNGKGQMPKYQGSIPSTSKLTDEELAEVAQYVQQRAGDNWK